MDRIHFSSSQEDWGTPQWLFDELNKKYKFDLDLFANEENALCKNFLTDCFAQIWTNKSYAFGNPPYRRTKPTTWDFVALAYHKWIFLNKKSVLLLPARTDTKGFHDYCLSGAIYFIKGRLTFKGAPDPAPFPSMLVVFDGSTGVYSYKGE